MSGTDTAAMVPTKFDCVINGYGFVFWRELMQSLPFRNQRASYSYTPTFIERTNVSGAYGDNTQDFFLTASQNDWSGGSGQHFFRSTDPQSTSRFWDSTAVEISVDGAASMRPAVTTTTVAAAVYAACPAGTVATADTHVYATSTNLYTVSPNTSVTDAGAHGAGTPASWSVCTDDKYVYIAGSTKIRSWDAAAFADFAAVANAGSLATLNNSLYSCDGKTLNVYDTAGNKTTLFTWKDNKGTARAVQLTAKIVPFGGRLLIFFQKMNNCPQLWIYDGTTTSKLAELPKSTIGYDIEVVQGVVFLSASIYDYGFDVATGGSSVVYSYLNGSLDELWRSPLNASLTAPVLGTFRGNLFFTDNIYQSLYEYDLKSGAVSSAADFSTEAAPNAAALSSAPDSLMLSLQRGTNLHVRFWPSSSSFASTALLKTSIFDFDNSLTKVFRGVKVEWTGGGGIDIAYLIDGNVVSDSYTTLASLVTGGIEYLFPADTRGRTISIKLTLSNLGAGGQPSVKRIYVRAAPVQQSYKRRSYVLDLGGTASSAGGVQNPVRLMNGTDSALTGAQMATNLVTAIESSSPISITDRFGTYTAVIEAGQSELDEVRPGEFVAQVTTREV